MSRIRLDLGLVAACVALAAAAPRARAQDVAEQAGATLDRDSVTVGDVVRLTLRVRAPLGATINFPAAADSLGPVQALEPPVVRNGSDSATAADRIAIYRLAAWDVGSIPIRLGDVVVQGDQGERSLAVPLPSLFVRSVLPADSALRVPKPARPLLDVRAPTPWWWYALAALAALLIGLGIWWWRRGRTGAGPAGDPFADAEQEFASIEKLRLVEAGEPGRYAALTTDVLRRYLAARIPSATLAQTSGELVTALHGARTVKAERVEKLFARVDPVKFARAPISAGDARAIGEESRAIVRAEHEQAEALEAAAAQQARAGAAA